MLAKGPLIAALILLSACNAVKTKNDALSLHLPPQQAQVCRDATKTEAAKAGLSERAIEEVYYQVMRRTRNKGSDVDGFEAWVTPKEGNKVLVVDLSTTCKVRRVWSKVRK